MSFLKRGTAARQGSSESCQDGRLRHAKRLRDFRLATILQPTYTDSFHALGCASVAQWQSTGFVNQWLWVRLPPLASQARNRRGQPANGRMELPATMLSRFRPCPGGI